MLGGSSQRHGLTGSLPMRRTPRTETAGRVAVLLATVSRWVLRLVIATFGSLLTAVACTLAATAVAFVLLALLLRYLGG